MPISSERHAGFVLSKWELNYLKCRYKAHRNKVAAAGPAIDAHCPQDRPHVRHKSKKALLEQQRQVRIMQENLRVLNNTAEIMSSAETVTEISFNSNSSIHRSKSSKRPLTSVTKRNTHILFQWFIHKFGKYVPWWAHIDY